jgi:hypothetical protein
MKAVEAQGSTALESADLRVALHAADGDHESDKRHAKAFFPVAGEPPSGERISRGEDSMRKVQRQSPSTSGAFDDPMTPNPERNAGSKTGGSGPSPLHHCATPVFANWLICFGELLRAPGRPGTPNPNHPRQSISKRCKSDRCPNEGPRDVRARDAPGSRALGDVRVRDGA